MASDPGPARKIAAVCKTGASICAQGASIVSLSVALAAIRAPTTTTSNAYARHTQFRERPICMCEGYLIGVTNAPKPRRRARHAFQVLGRWGTYMNTRPMNSVVDKSTKSTAVPLCSPTGTASRAQVCVSSSGAGPVFTECFANFRFAHGGAP